MGSEFYLLGIIIPVLVILVSIIGGLKCKRIFLVPSFVLAASLIWSILEMTLRNVGWASLLGWSVIYTVLSLVIVSVVRVIRKKV